MKKVTMKDIAREAGVSVATVSYVLSNNEKETIPEETRNRILNIARALNYVPNLAARSLVKKKSGLIGVLIVKNYGNEKPWRTGYYTEFVERLENLLSERGYHVLISNIDSFSPNLDIILSRELDGVFIIDVNLDIFYQISNRFSVPIIVIDSYIDDVIFHKIVPDFNDAIERAFDLLKCTDCLLIMDKFNNKETIEKIKSNFKGRNEDIHVVKDIETMREFLKNNPGRKAIVIGEYLGVIVSRYIKPEDVAVICTSGNSYLLDDKTHKIIINNDLKAKKSVELMMEYISGHYSDNKYTVIKAE
ncbi:LacI family DNA-binding transcriptional regulator [Fonticella tunisiensis]|uniref:DNA-binding LacI/PurR family transcriptional regulator n=1 Tax=Fonticella tunisiensis TaxID=1096341 RepID=A0A4R7KBH3_9CLOT|nr:LacI family DNA-binding transcriptional regulator [Fonticella tunisiensis]TDT51997.1 DNA-binding LacI/PurR family transcriptional regulator [Fonticella tunisiensis]